MSGCAIYYSKCGGQCIYTGNDPNHCGGCDIKCKAGEVCSAGGCQAGCLPGLTACNGSCGDDATDNKNCGGCGKACGKDQGCVEGACVTAAVFDAPKKCAGGSGPPISIGTGMTECLGDLGATSFTWALCSCTNVLVESKILVDGFDSTKGPYMPGELGGGVGANAHVTASEGSIYGQLWTGKQGLISDSGLTVYDDLQSAGALTTSGLDIKKDAYVAGAINGDIKVGGTLHTPNDPSNGNGDATYGKLAVGPVKTSQACDCSTPIPVADIVKSKKTNNDNALIKLDPGILNGANHPARIDLPCGEYYLTGFNLTSAGAIVVHGHTAIYVDGNISASAFLDMTPEPGGTLDLFVSGTIGADMFGSIFAKDFEASADLNIHYDRAIVTQGSDCPPPGGGGGSGGSSGGGTGTGGGPTCGSCKDCSNQACTNGACGNCLASADCCAPLRCVEGSLHPSRQVARQSLGARRSDVVNRSAPEQNRKNGRTIERIWPHRVDCTCHEGACWVRRRVWAGYAWPLSV